MLRVPAVDEKRKREREMETTEGMREKGGDKKEEQKEACCLTNPFCVLEFLAV